MISEQKVLAETYRAEGQGIKQEILGKQEKEEKEILSEAYLKSQILIGNADARAIEIYANAYDGYKEFYNFKRTLDSYKSSIDSTTKIILSTDNKYLKYLNQK